MSARDVDVGVGQPRPVVRRRPRPRLRARRAGDACRVLPGARPAPGVPGGSLGCRRGTGGRLVPRRDRRAARRGGRRRSPGRRPRLARAAAARGDLGADRAAVRTQRQPPARRRAVGDARRGPRTATGCAPSGSTLLDAVLAARAGRRDARRRHALVARARAVGRRDAARRRPGARRPGRGRRVQRPRPRADGIIALAAPAASRRRRRAGRSRSASRRTPPRWPAAAQYTFVDEGPDVLERETDRVAPRSRSCPATRASRSSTTAPGARCSGWTDLAARPSPEGRHAGRRRR